MNIYGTHKNCSVAEIVCSYILYYCLQLVIFAALLLDSYNSKHSQTFMNVVVAKLHQILIYDTKVCLLLCENSLQSKTLIFKYMYVKTSIADIFSFFKTYINYIFFISE